MSKIFDQIIKVLGSMFTSSSVKNDTVYQVRAAYKNDDDSEASAVTLYAHSSGRNGIYSSSNSKWISYADDDGVHLGPCASHVTTTTTGRNNLAKMYIGTTLLRDVLYPVGSIYMSTVSTSPATIWGGTWESIGVGKTLVSAGTGYTVNTTGGSTTTSYTPAGTNAGTAISIDQMPKHDGHIKTYSGSLKYYMPKSAMVSYGSEGRGWQEYSGGEVLPASNNTGGGKTHTHTFTGTAASINVMQPWYAVYMWRRTE